MWIYCSSQEAFPRSLARSLARGAWPWSQKDAFPWSIWLELIRIPIVFRVSWHGSREVDPDRPPSLLLLVEKSGFRGPALHRRSIASNRRVGRPLARRPPDGRLAAEADRVRFRIQRLNVLALSSRRVASRGAVFRTIRFAIRAIRVIRWRSEVCVRAMANVEFKLCTPDGNSIRISYRAIQYAPTGLSLRCIVTYLELSLSLSRADFTRKCTSFIVHSSIGNVF